MNHTQLSRSRGSLRQQNLRALCQHALSFVGGFLLAGAQLRTQALPLGACLVGAQSRVSSSLVTALGAVLGYFLRCEPADAVELSALSVLMPISLLLFRGTGLTVKKWFMPLCCSVICGVLGGVRLVGSVEIGVSVWLAKTLLAGLCTDGFRKALGGDRRARVLLGAAVVMGLTEIGGYIDLGLMGAVLIGCVSRELLPAAAVGIALDLRGPEPSVMTIAMVLPAMFCRLMAVRGRGVRAFAYGLLPVVALLFFGQLELWQILSVVPGAVGGYVLSRSPLLPKTVVTSEDTTVKLALEEAAVMLDTLGGELPRNPKPCKTEAEAVFDAAAEQVCRKCAFFHRCWQNRARETYEELSKAADRIMERGIAGEEDFSPEFRQRCCAMDRLLYTVNRELEGMLYRRRYHMQLEENRQILAQEYGLLAQYLRNVGSRRRERGERRFSPRVSICSLSKEQKEVCGDRGACFMGPGSNYFVILCDGMGTGAEAAQLSSHAIRLLEKLLKGGLEPQAALKLLNGNMLLRGSSAFSTIDLLQLDLHSGMAYLFKWGAAPSYWRDGQQIKKIGTATPPPGVGVGEDHLPEQFKLSLRRGEMLVLISDGAYGEETEAAISAYRNSSPQELAALLIGRMKAEDDMTAIVVSLRLRGS